MSIPFDMALLKPGDLIAPWGDPGADPLADVQALMDRWAREASEFGVVIDGRPDVVTRLALMLYVPPPVRGGTYLYCPWRQRIPHGVVSCGVPRPGWATGTRFREMKDYRRHWRRCHLGDL